MNSNPPMQQLSTLSAQQQTLVTQNNHTSYANQDSNALLSNQSKWTTLSINKFKLMFGLKPQLKVYSKIYHSSLVYYIYFHRFSSTTTFYEWNSCVS
jgi:hypothetical protein